MSREFKVANCWKKKICVNFTNQKKKKMSVVGVGRMESAK